MTISSKSITAVALATTLAATITVHFEHGDGNHPEPEKIPLSFVSLSANNSISASSSGTLFVQNSITDDHYRIVQTKTPETTQG